MQAQDEQLSQAVRHALQQQHTFKQIVQQAKAHATASQHPITELESSILQHLLASGGASYICNTAFAAKEQLQLPHSAFPTVTQASGGNVRFDVDRELRLQGLPTESLQNAKQAWQKLLLERLHYLQAKVELPLVSPNQSQLKIQTATTEETPVAASARVASGDQPYLASVPLLQESYLFGIADWYSLVTTLLNSHWDSISTALSTEDNRTDDCHELSTDNQTIVSNWTSWPWLQQFFQGLNAQHRQVGLDDLLHPWFQQSSIKTGEACLEIAAIPQCRAALQRGAAPALRPRLWATALALDLEHESLGDSFENLCRQVEECNLLTDLLIEQDLETVANSEHFFLFEESLRAVLLAASRDPSLGPSCHHKPFPCLVGKTASGQTQGPYPPSGLLPCRGLVEYAAPLCYLYAEQASCAIMFCSMYARFWCRLHTIDNTAGKDATLVSLCVLFLHLLEEGEAEVAEHLKAVGCPPLQLALPWIMTAFAGHLAVGEVLLVWDRIIGFDSLLPLPLLAVAVIAFRRQVLLAADSREQIMSTMEDLSQLKVVPLLQGMLFGR
ncbi:TPA: hypothetical protein ACH3X1_013053 [Trebouxia sp. C0004]